MSAGGLYKKSNIQENLVITSHPLAKDRCKDGKKPPLSRVLAIMLLPLGAEDPWMGHQCTHEISFNLTLISLDGKTWNNSKKEI